MLRLSSKMVSFLEATSIQDPKKKSKIFTRSVFIFVVGKGTEKGGGGT